MFEILKMAQILTEMQTSQKKEDPEEVIQNAVMNNQKINPQFFEERIQSPEIKMLKTAMPYMHPNHSHVLEAFVKVLELQKLTEMYSGIAANLRNNDSDWRIEMLGAMRPHLVAEKQDMIDIAVHMISLTALMQKMRNRGVASYD